jgi:microcystin-dependent protein
MYSFQFAPQGWAACNGQLLPINQNQALFSILGTTFGGNGTTNFALPNLQSRVPLHWGQGAGLPPVSLGQVGGTETHTLLTTEMPGHTHQATANSGATNAGPAVNNNWCTEASNAYTTNAPTGSMNATAVGNAGSGQPHNNIQPYLTVNFCIALQGIFPSRN